MKKSRIIYASLILSALCLCTTGCGKEKYDITAQADITLNGCNGYGTASLSKGDWIEEVELKHGSEMSLMEIAVLEETLNKAVTYDISPVEGLSNGDEVVVDIKVNSDLLEKYDFKLNGGTKKFTVEGLADAEPFDPFEGVAVQFSGMAPNGQASISTADSRSDISLNYKLDKDTGLKNGDEVTVTVSSPGGSDLQDYCISYGKIPTETEKKFTVGDLASYASSVNDIPEDSLNKMLSQAEDTFKSSAASWKEGNSIKKIENLGYYFLTPKEGFSSYPNNEIYCVFKITADITGFKDEEESKGDAEMKTREDTYYTYFHYSDIVLLPDGTCSFDLSAGKQPTNSINSEYGYVNWWFSYYTFYGYKDLDSMFNECVTAKIANYNYESTVK